MRLESAYLLAGPEAGKRAAFVDELRAAVKAADGAAAEEHRLYAYESGVGELLAQKIGGVFEGVERCGATVYRNN